MQKPQEQQLFCETRYSFMSNPISSESTREVVKNTQLWEEGARGYKKGKNRNPLVLELFIILSVGVDAQTYTADKNLLHTTHTYMNT